jgi:hypothetical protein
LKKVRNRFWLQTKWWVHIKSRSVCVSAAIIWTKNSKHYKSFYTKKLFSQWTHKMMVSYFRIGFKDFCNTSSQVKHKVLTWSVGQFYNSIDSKNCWEDRTTKYKEHSLNSWFKINYLFLQSWSQWGAPKFYFFI